MDVSHLIEKLKNFKTYVGNKVIFLMLITAFAGVMGFLVEACFMMIIQGFLLSIGLSLGTQKFLPDWYPTALSWNILILVLFGLFRSSVIFMRAYMAGKTGVIFINQKRSQILAKALYTKNLKSISEIIDTFGDRIFLSGVVLQDMTQILYLICLMSCLGLFGLYLAPVEFMIAVAMFSVVYFNQRYIHRRLKGVNSGVWQSWNIVFNTLYWGLQNNFLIKLYGLEGRETSKAQAKLKENTSLHVEYYKVVGLAGALTTVFGISVVAILSYVSISYFKTDPLKLLGLFYLFTRLSGAVSEANGHSSSVKMYWDRFVSVKNYLSSDIPEISKKEPSGRTLDALLNIQSLSAKNLKFGYLENQSLLNDISFDLKSGDILLIKGESGSGKSTLLRLLFGLNEPRSGQILYNNIPLTQIRSQLHSHIGYVGPDAFLLNGTVRENLLYANIRENVTDEEMLKSLANVQLMSLFQSFEKGFGEYLNEDTQISTGQKQRLAIARALLRDPQILVLDEATANLDRDTELKIIDIIQKLSQSKIVVVISHKDTFDNIATVKINLSKGSSHSSVLNADA